MIEKPSLVLTRENYQSPEANRVYMSAHQYSAWLECAAKEKAKQDGTLNDAFQRADYTPEPETHFTVGNYVDYSLLAPDELQAFIHAHHDEIFTAKGMKKADFVMADAMIARIRRDRFAMSMLEGEHQKIIAYFWAGCWWKSMMDCIRTDKIIVDLKTSKAVDTGWEWSDEFKKRVPFYEAYNYWRNGAIYMKGAELVMGPGDWMPVLLVVTKQKPPDLRGYQFTVASRFMREWQGIEANMPQILEWKSGRVEAPRCETCDYCRATKELSFETARNFYEGELIGRNPLKE